MGPCPQSCLSPVREVRPWTSESDQEGGLPSTNDLDGFGARSWFVAAGRKRIALQRSRVQFLALHQQSRVVRPVSQGRLLAAALPLSGRSSSFRTLPAGSRPPGSPGICLAAFVPVRERVSFESGGGTRMRFGLREAEVAVPYGLLRLRPNGTARATSGSGDGKRQPSAQMVSLLTVRLASPRGSNE